MTPDIYTEEYQAWQFRSERMISISTRYPYGLGKNWRIK